MFEECIECLAQGGRSDEAKEMALKYIKINENPKILCIYGELINDKQYLKNSWKKSNKKFARAQRSLGRLYFYEKNYKKAIKAFRKAVSINYYYPNIWFTLGCAYMQVNELDNASKAFSTVVTIDESQGEAWANLAAIFM